MPRKPKIENVTRRWGKAHARKEAVEAQMAKDRKLFFDLIQIPESELSRQTIYAECDDPDAYVASLYPKWRILSKKLVDEDIPDEWQLVIQEDPQKRNFTYINPLDGQVYTRTVAESAPAVDLERLEAENPDAYKAITFQPEPPPRELKALKDLTDDQKKILKKYLLPVKLTNRMEKPRKPKPEELEQTPDRTSKR
jgi:hypothetical protein